MKFFEVGNFAEPTHLSLRKIGFKMETYNFFSAETLLNEFRATYLYPFPDWKFSLLESILAVYFSIMLKCSAHSEFWSFLEERTIEEGSRTRQWENLRYLNSRSPTCLQKRNTIRFDPVKIDFLWCLLFFWNFVIQKFFYVHLHKMPWY